MQPTAPPGWGWAGAARRRLRVHVHDPRDRPRIMIRAETLMDHWASTSRDGPPIPWQDPEFMQLMQKIRYERPMDELLRGSSTGVVTADDRSWENALRGWAAGALLLAALLLVVRALERFLQRKLKERHPSIEWPNPTVFATSQLCGGGSLQLEESDSFPSESPDSNNDLPPPYSECANLETPINDNKPTVVEEPPPPYSACYFSNPKNGLPSVHFYSRRGAEIGESSRASDTTIIAVSETDSAGDVNRDNASRTNQRCELNVCDEVNSDLQNASNEAASRERVEAVDLSTSAKIVSV